MRVVGATRDMWLEPRAMEARPAYIDLRKQKMTEGCRKLLNRIPFYPDEVSALQLIDVTGLSSDRIESYLKNLGTRGLVCEDQRRYCRLREDLSNVD